MIFLITATGDSGSRYSIWYECDDEIDAQVMCRDCLNGVIEGELSEVVDMIATMEGMTEQ